MLKAEENRLKHFSIEALRIRLAELKTKIHMVSEPVSILKKFVADAHKDESFQGYPVLPKSMWDGSRHVKSIAAYLNNLIHMDMCNSKN